MTEKPKDGLHKAIDDVFSLADVGKLRCSKCEGKAIIDSEDPSDNRTRKVIRCLECDFEEGLDVVKQGR